MFRRRWHTAGPTGSAIALARQSQLQRQDADNPTQAGFLLRSRKLKLNPLSAGRLKGSTSRCYSYHCWCAKSHPHGISRICVDYRCRCASPAPVRNPRLAVDAQTLELTCNAGDTLQCWSTPGLDFYEECYCRHCETDAQGNVQCIRLKPHEQTGPSGPSVAIPSAPQRLPCTARPDRGACYKCCVDRGGGKQTVKNCLSQCVTLPPPKPKSYPGKGCRNNACCQIECGKLGTGLPYKSCMRICKAQFIQAAPGMPSSRLQILARRRISRQRKRR